MEEVLPSLEGCSLDLMAEGIGQRAAELVPSQEPERRFPPLAWEYDMLQKSHGNYN